MERLCKKRKKRRKYVQTGEGVCGEKVEGRGEEFRKREVQVEKDVVGGESRK